MILYVFSMCSQFGPVWDQNIESEQVTFYICLMSDIHYCKEVILLLAVI